VVPIHHHEHRYAEQQLDGRLTGITEYLLTWEEDTGNWSAVDEDLGVGSVGDTREEALANLDEAVALHTGEAGEPVTDDDLEEWGIDPEFGC